MVVKVAFWMSIEAHFFRVISQQTYYGLGVRAINGFVVYWRAR